MAKIFNENIVKVLKRLFGFIVLLVQIATTRNTVVASLRGMIAVIENNTNEGGLINIPKALQPYMGGKEKIEIK